MMIMKKEYKA
jgi:hypothetical protein